MISSDFRFGVINGLQAHFLQPDGPSRPGVDWIVSVVQQSVETRVVVRTYSDDTPTQTVEQQAKAAVDFLAKLLASGWRLSDYKGLPGELIVPGLSATPIPPAMPDKKVWWRRLFGRA